MKEKLDKNSLDEKLDILIKDILSDLYWEKFRDFFTVRKCLYMIMKLTKYDAENVYRLSPTVIGIMSIKEMFELITKD